MTKYPTETLFNMIVKDMLDDMKKNPKLGNVERHIHQSLRNAALLAHKHVETFIRLGHDLEYLIKDSSGQFQVLSQAVNDDDETLFAFNITTDPVAAFKELLPTDYDTLERQFAVASEGRNN